MSQHGHDPSSQSSSNHAHTIDALASPPLYSEAEEATNHLPGPSQISNARHRVAQDSQQAAHLLEVAAPTGRDGIAGAAVNQEVPSYEASATGGDRTVLGGPLQSSAYGQDTLGLGSSNTGPLARAHPLEQDDCFFDIAPASDATSFQVGYLGLEGFQAWVKGEVLLKLGGSMLSESDNAASDTQGGQRSDFYKCIIELRAVESIDTTATSSGAERATEVELFYSKLALWDATAATSSTALPTELPTTMPFSFPLTQDLPHCVHLPKSRLTYSLRATLHSSNAAVTPDMVKQVPVHLTRYSAPDPLPSLSLTTSAFNLEPHVWQTSTPTEAYVELERTLYRRSEPMNFRVLIPALSDRRLMTEKSLHLRAVEADLVRIITVLCPSSSAPRCGTALKSKEKGKTLEEDPTRSRNSTNGEHSEYGQDVPSYTAAMEHQEPVEGEAGPSYHGSAQQTMTASSSASAIPSEFAAAAHDAHDCESCAPTRIQPERFETLLAHSGKLCRFSTHRAVNLRLTLHPPFSAPNMPHPHPDHDAFAVAARSAAMYIRPGSAMVSDARSSRDHRAELGYDGVSERNRDFESGAQSTRVNERIPRPASASVELAAPGSLAGGSGCESVSQETLLHRVQFEVRVRIALDGGPAGRRDIRFVREVRVLPGAAGSVMDLPSSSLAGRASSTAAPDPGPTSLLEQKGISSSSGKRAVIVDGPFASFNDDEEYDGYEDVLQDLDPDELLLAEGDVADTSLGSVAAVPYLAPDAAGTSGAGTLRNASAIDVPRFAAHPNAVTRSAESMDAEPPPSMQQAEHDLQVEEVEVEGVGFAVPRRRVGGSSHGMDVADETVPGFYESFPPPPPLSPAEESGYPYANLHVRHPSDEILPPPSPDQPPGPAGPPDTAAVHGSTHSDPESAQDHVSAPLPQIVAGTSAQRGSRPVAGHNSAQHEPPPYLPADLPLSHHRERPPPFHAGSADASHSIRPLILDAGGTEGATPLASAGSPTRLAGLASPAGRRLPEPAGDEPPPGIEEPSATFTDRGLVTAPGNNAAATLCSPPSARAPLTHRTDPSHSSASHEDDAESSENTHRLLSTLPPAYVQPLTVHASSLPAFQGPPSYSLR